MNDVMTMTLPQIVATSPDSNDLLLQYFQEQGIAENNPLMERLVKNARSLHGPQGRQKRGNNSAVTAYVQEKGFNHEVEAMLHTVLGCGRRYHINRDVDKEPDRAQRELDQLVGLLKNGPCGVPAARWAEWIRNLPASNRAGGSEFMATVAGQLRLAASDYARRMGAFDVVS